MNRLMLSVVAYTKQLENGSYKRVKEQYIIPGDTFTTAEDFVYNTLAQSMQGEVILESLKREAVDGVLYEDNEVIESWYKCKATTPDPESEKEKSIALVYYVNATSVEKANGVLKTELKSLYSDFSITHVDLTKIVDIYGK